MAKQASIMTWWHHQTETFSALPVPGEFPAQRPVTRSFDVFFDLRLNKRLSKQSWGWWFETLSRPLWRHRNESSHNFKVVCMNQIRLLLSLLLLNRLLIHVFIIVCSNMLYNSWWNWSLNEVGWEMLFSENYCFEQNAQLYNLKICNVFCHNLSVWNKICSSIQFAILLKFKIWPSKLRTNKKLLS